MKNRLLTTVLAMLSILPAYAQRQYDIAQRKNFWNDGDNAAGIRFDDRSLSVAALSSSYEGGGYRTLSQSSGEWSVGAMAKSVRYLPRYSMKGGFSFMDTEARNMCGSMFMDEGFFPVDVYEFTPGRKTFQSYSMDGSVAVDLWNGWTVGTGLDFKARNAAKRKDLRYSAYRLDIEANPSVVYTSYPLRFGANLYIGRNTETISAEQTGSAEVPPFAFFDEGLSLGNWQVWTGNGSRLKESGVNGLPVQQNVYGAGLQISSCDGSLYGELDFRWKKGKVGERQVIWYRYEGPVGAARAGYRFGNSALRAEFGWSLLENRETVQDKVVEGGVSIVHEYGSNPVLKEARKDLALEYEYLTGCFDASAKLLWNSVQSLSTPVYPYVYTRDLNVLGVQMIGHYRLQKLESGLSLGWTKGFSEDDVRTVSETGSTSMPFRHEEVWENKCRYEDSGRLDVGASLSWNFWKGMSAALDGRCLYAPVYEAVRYKVQAGLFYEF